MARDAAGSGGDRPRPWRALCADRQPAARPEGDAGIGPSFGYANRCNRLGGPREASEAELFDLQDAIALRIATGMLPSLRAAELRRALRRQPDSYTAYEHTLRALDIINMPDRATSDQARGFLDLAMAEDPGFAMPVAWAPGGIACVSARAGLRTRRRRPHARFPWRRGR